MYVDAELMPSFQQEGTDRLLERLLGRSQCTWYSLKDVRMLHFTIKYQGIILTA